MSYHTYISSATLKYLHQQYPEHTPAWLASFTEEVYRLEALWDVQVEGFERDSRFGTILYGHSAQYGQVALKIIPWFTPRLKGEVYCYQRLPYQQMCPLSAVDEKLGALLLKYVPLDGADHPATKEASLAALYAQRSPATQEDEQHLPRYENVLADVSANALTEIARTNDPGYAHLALSIQRAQQAMAAMAAEKRYVIHGDAHAYNLLVEGDHCLMIDPLGYIAPFAFEWARYLGSAIKAADMPAEELRALALRLIGDDISLELMLRALAIDTTLRACNTFIEGNTYEEICFSADWAQRAWAYYDALKHT